MHVFLFDNMNHFREEKYVLGISTLLWMTVNCKTLRGTLLASCQDQMNRQRCCRSVQAVSLLADYFFLLVFEIVPRATVRVTPTARVFEKHCCRALLV